MLRRHDARRTAPDPDLGPRPAALRRRLAGALQPSRFLAEIPAKLTENLRAEAGGPQIDLFGERHQVRESVRRNAYTGKTYNSLEHIQQFFAARGMPPAAQPWAASPQPRRLAKPPARRKKGLGGGLGDRASRATGGARWSGARARATKPS